MNIENILINIFKHNKISLLNSLIYISNFKKTSNM